MWIVDNGTSVAQMMRGQFRDRVVHLGIVGTDPSARGRRLATACRNHTLGLARVSGEYDCVKLHVDSASPTRATGLDERSGFAVAKVFANY